MITLKYDGEDDGGLMDGTYVNVPTNWTTVQRMVSKNAIPEIMEALKKEWIRIEDYDYVFTLADSRFKTPKGNRVLLHWEKV